MNPSTLLEVVTYFSDERRAFEYIKSRRWPSGNVACPRCGSEKVHFIESRLIWRCNGCRKQFSAKVGTIFEDSPISFSKWLPAIWLIANAKNGISSYELHRALGVTQKTAWFMLHRIRLALQEDGHFLLGGGGGPEVEVDETYIGGKKTNMHKDKQAKLKGTGMVGKQIVLGILERKGRVRTYHVAANHGRELLPRIIANVHPDTQIYSDALGAYHPLKHTFKHEFVDHTLAYVSGQVHTNNLENYWSLLKRTIKGTYVSVEPFHLFRYLDEQSFRYNTRKDNDAGRFQTALKTVVGRRLTYNELTGKAVQA